MESYKIVKKSTMPDGTEMQIEDWRNIYPDSNLMLAVFPVCKKSLGWFIEGRTMRAEIRSLDDAEVFSIFTMLERGEINLAQCKVMFDRPEDIAYCLMWS